MDEKRIRILNVEDEEVDHMALVRMVEEKGLPYILELAAGCSEALEMFEKGEYDLVLIDYMMPNGTGLDLLEKIKGIPCIIVTGSGSEEVAVKAMKGGAYDYLIKDPGGAYLALLPLAVEKAMKAFRLEEERREMEDELRRNLEEAERVNVLMVKREFRMEELKRENEALKVRIRDLEGGNRLEAKGTGL